MNSRQTTQRKITFCITELDVGGAEKALVRVAIGFSERGWDVRVISLRDRGPLAEPLTEAGIPVEHLNCGGMTDVRAFWRLRSALKRNTTDVLLCFLNQANLYGRLAGKAAGIPLILSGIRVADKRRSIVIPERLTRRWVDYYVAVSNHVAKTHAALCGISSDRMAAIPNGVDVPDNFVKEHTNEPPHQILFVGRLTEQKDPLNLLLAFLLLPESVQQQTSVTLVGDGPLRGMLQRFVDDHQLQARVTLTGHSSQATALMQQATILALPSKWEGMPNVVLEAMANQLPVVATALSLIHI